MISSSNLPTFETCCQLHTSFLRSLAIQHLLSKRWLPPIPVTMPWGSAPGRQSACVLQVFFCATSAPSSWHCLCFLPIPTENILQALVKPSQNTAARWQGKRNKGDKLSFIMTKSAEFWGYVNSNFFTASTTVFVCLRFSMFDYFLNHPDSSFFQNTLWHAISKPFRHVWNVKHFMDVFRANMHFDHSLRASIMKPTI